MNEDEEYSHYYYMFLEVFRPIRDIQEEVDCVENEMIKRDLGGC